MARSLVLYEHDGKVEAKIENVADGDYPSGDVTVAVQYSTINYKDGMIIKGIGRMVRKYPHIPGIDFAGVVESSENPDFTKGDPVLLTGWRVGESWWGGYSEKAVVQGDWLVHKPEGMSLKHTMALGTAGFTAMLAVIALEEHDVFPERGPVLVTGATGGVGSVAVALLSNLGYSVTASTGKTESHTYLKDLGAAEIIDRGEIGETTKRPLDKERWSGCIDNVGGETLARVLTHIKHRGSIAAVGLAAGNVLNTTLLPFLLRGINLLGIDSTMCPHSLRKKAWERLALDMAPDKLELMLEEKSLDDLPDLASRILKGHVRGRTVIRTTRIKCPAVNP